MARELPYFQFEPSEWQNGAIYELSHEHKGLFMDVCCFYWVKSCNVSLEAYSTRFKRSAKIAQDLIDECIVKVIDDEIIIDFLVAQRVRLEKKSETLAENGRKGGSKCQAIAKQMLSPAKASLKPSQADKIRRDENREEEISEEELAIQQELYNQMKNAREIQVNGNAKGITGSKLYIKESVSADVSKRIIDDLNDVCSTSYKHSTPKTVELIATRMKEGFSEQDFYTVHRNMFATWSLDTKMREFLRPITLYSNKFESYLNKVVNVELDKYSDSAKKTMQNCANFIKNMEQQNA